ncbi:hypothetical protein GCM10010174_88420 [Kutzneria viridogrisea]
MEDVIASLNRSLRHLEAAQRHLDVCLGEWAGAAERYRAVLHESQHAEAIATREAIAALDENAVFVDLVEWVATVRGLLLALLRLYCGEHTPPPVPGPPAQPPGPGQPPPRTPPAVTNGHGDRYPPEAAGLAETLPPRVVPRTGQRTVGVPRIAGTVAPPISSGYDPDLSPAVNRRLTQMGIDSDFLDAHVETKIAAKMIETGQRDVEVCVNYVPCGIETQRSWPDVCDKILDEFLPIGYTLRVYGTTKDNQPFKRTYGRAT